MSARLLLLASGLWAVAGAALAQNAPTQLQVETARAQAAEYQAQYFLLLLKAEQAKAEETAAFWAEVWKALPPQKK